MRNLFMLEELVKDFGRAVNADKHKLMKGTTTFPAVNFSCAGNISAWTAAGEYHGNGRGRDPQLGTGCTAESFAESSRRQLLKRESKKRVYRFTLAQPLSFVEDDIIVIKQFQDTLLKVFYSEDSQRRRRMSSRVRTLTNSVPLITLGKLMPCTRFHTTYCHTSTHSILSYQYTLHTVIPVHTPYFSIILLYCSTELELPCLTGERRLFPCIKLKDSACPAELPRWLS